jgi:hypothetical protein
MQSFHDEFWVNPAPPTLVNPFVTTLRVNAKVPAITFGQLTHTLSSNTVWDARVGRFVLDLNNDPSSGDRTAANHSDQATGISSGNAPEIGGLLIKRLTAKAVLNHYTSGWFGGVHQMRVGTSVERGEHSSPAVIPGGIRYVDNAGQPFQAVSRTPAISGGRFYTAALFASDSLTINDRVTVNAGLRYDHSDAISQDLNALDTAGQEIDTVIQGLGKLYTWNVISPRLGVTAKLTQTGRTILRASYGRFNQGVLTGELSPFHPGVTPTTTTAFDAATGGYTTPVSVVDPRINLALDPNTRTPRTDEYSIGLDREITPRLAAAVAYIHKEGSDFIAWTDVGGQYREETRTLTNGQVLPVFVLTNGTAARRFLLTNPNDYSLTYNGLVLALEKRRSDRWQATGSYTYSRTSGLQASSGTTADGAQLSTVAPNNAFGRDPNNLTNAEGGCAAHRVDGCRKLPAVQRQALGGDDERDAAAGESAHSARATWNAPPPVTIAARSACLKGHELHERARRVATRCAERAQRHGLRVNRDRQLVQCDVRSANALHRPAPRDAQRSDESGPLESGPRVVSAFRRT